MPRITYREAVCKALADELRADEDVIFSLLWFSKAARWQRPRGPNRGTSPPNVREMPVTCSAAHGSSGA